LGGNTVVVTKSIFYYYSKATDITDLKIVKVNTQQIISPILRFDMEYNKVLVVDDEPHLLRSLTFVLAKAGYKITMAGDGEEALKKINEETPDIILLDVMMPKKNGYEVLETLRSIPEYKNIYVIILSAKGSDNDRVKALSVGANEFVSKPFSPIEMVARVKNIFTSEILSKKLKVID